MQEKNKTVLRICLGSSCYSRGNSKVLNRVKEYLDEHNLEDQVDFRGELCSGNCARGPVFTINGQVFEQVDEHNIVRILDDYLTKAYTP